MTASSTKHHLWHFHGGLHLESNKDLSNSTETRKMPLPEILVIPRQQHIGEPAEPVVNKGERVLKGQMIARASGYISTPVHATSSGTVVDISKHPVAHPSGLDGTCIVIETDGKDEWAEHTAVSYANMDPSHLRNLIREAGIVGMGGAGFPSFIKLNPGSHKEIDTLIINGAECEPYITCDDKLMRDKPEEIIAGIRIMRHALHAKRCIIGLEDNKPEALEALQKSLGNADDIELITIPTIYPAGGEKQIIKVLTGKEVPAQGLPIDIDVVCHNVATATAVYRAIEHGEPLLSRYVTVTGSAIDSPGNVEVPIGTPVRKLLEFCNVDYDALGHVMVGGPMMGFSLHHLDSPVVRVTNCLLTYNRNEIEPQRPSLPCIRCAECVNVCPANLLPQQMYWYAHSRDFEKIQDYNLFDCIECGCCNAVCPSHIPLVQYFRFAKTSIWDLEREKSKADVARHRHEFRLERLEREKLEREERRRRKMQALKKPDNADDSKKAAIQAAVDRVRKKKLENPVQPKNVKNLTQTQAKLIEEVDKRRAQTTKPENKPNNEEQD